MYRYYFDESGQVVYATTTYAKKVVRGKAICSPEDNFNIFSGALLAKARCDVKVGEKRLKNAEKRLIEAENEYKKAKDYRERMKAYKKDASEQLKEYKKGLKNLLKTM